MPWKPRVSREEVAEAVFDASSWGVVLERLGYPYHGKNIATIRKWAERWDISTEHLTDSRSRSSWRLKYTEQDLRTAVAESFSWAETLRRLGYCPTGGNWKTLKKRVTELGIHTDHFDPYRASRQRSRRGRRPLSEILVTGSNYCRWRLKERLYETGLKKRNCELCGQGTTWNGREISLILDHINGVRDDNRLENLRIVCPNCAAGLDTHCGRKNRIEVEPRSCRHCGQAFMPKYQRHRYCSVACGRRSRPGPARSRPEARKVERPPHDQLVREVKENGYLATGRRYGVSDNAVRKWIRQYERERAVAEGGDPEAVVIPTRTWPNRKDRIDEAA
jgi:hypothetical protein